MSTGAPKNEDDLTSSDEAVSQFLALTDSTDASQAKSYLEMSANDLQTAINLFLEHQQGGGSMSSSSMGGNSGGNMTSSTSATAAGGGSRGAGFGDDVRAPDRTRRDRLLGPSGVGDMGSLLSNPMLAPHAAMMNLNGAGHMADIPPHLSAFSNSASRFTGVMDNEDMIAGGGMAGNVRDLINASTSSASASAQGPMSSGADGNAQTDDEDVEVLGTARSSSRSLSGLFAAPVHLIHSAGGFQGARNVAKDTRRWLLVNLQNDSDFACHALNRDVWRNDLVENLVREGFIFWQSVNLSAEGRTYAERYDVQSYPHIGIIDPRTARLVFRKEGWTQEDPLTAERFAELAADFCSRNSFDKAPPAPRNPLASAAGPAAMSQHTFRAPSPTVDLMSEEEQLQAAIRASMNQASGLNNHDDESDLDDTSQQHEYMMDSDMDDNEHDANQESDVAMDTGEDGDAAVEEVKEITFHEEIVAIDVGEEPSGSDGIARIMIRMPDGKRLVRKFKLDDTVKMVYAFVSQSNDDAKDGKEFELKAGFPPKNLMPMVNDTIQSSGLAGDSVTVRWKDE